VRPARAALVAGAGVAAIVLLATVSPFAERVRSIADPQTVTGRGRIVQWERTLHMIADRPVIGFGPDTYAMQFPRYIDARFERTVGRDVVPDRAHNVFLDLASNAGLLGVAAYVAVVVLVVLVIVRTLHRDPVTVGLSGAAFAYLVQLQFSFPLADLDALFWLFAGMIVGPGLARRRRISRRWAAVPVAAAVLFGLWGTLDVAADRTLRGALEAEAGDDLDTARRRSDRAAAIGIARAQYLQANARVHLRAGEITANTDDFMRSLKALSSAQQIVPGDVELAIDRADLFLSWGQVASDRRLIQRSAEGYEEILERDRFSSRAHLKLGVAYVELGRQRDAEREWLTAASLAPDSPAPLDNLVRLYEQQGRNEDARRMRARAERLEQ
jgi:hypothetical protein